MKREGKKLYRHFNKYGVERWDLTRYYDQGCFALGFSVFHDFESIDQIHIDIGPWTFLFTFFGGWMVRK